MLYDDNVLLDLAKNFGRIQWSMLTVLSCDKEGVILPLDNVQSILISEFAGLLQSYMGRPLAPYLRNLNLAVLEGARAIEFRPGQVDRRAKEISITENGYRLMQFYVTGGIQIA